MVGSKRYLTNRGKQPVTDLPKDKGESVKQEIIAALDPNTPTPEPQRLVDTSECNKEDHAGEGSSIRARLQKTPTRERFHELAHEYQNLKKVQELEDKVIVLYSDKIGTEIIIESLIQERDKVIAYRDIIVREKGNLIFYLVNLQNQASAPMIEATATRKTTKIPDAPIFSDSKEVRFKIQETVIRQKLEANTDYYPLLVYLKLYIQGRYEGKAQLYIVP